MKTGPHFLYGVLAFGAFQACVVSQGVTAARGIEPGDPAGPTTVTSTDTTEPIDSGADTSTEGGEDAGADAP